MPSRLHNQQSQRLEEGVGSGRGEDGLAVARSLAVGQRELELLGEELLDVRSPDVLRLLNLNNLEDVDRPEASAVAGGHVLVESDNGLTSGHLTVLLVHVVGTRARVVSDPDTEVLDLERVLLVDLVQAHDLTVGLLDLAELGQEVPETGLGNNIVRCEDAHAVELRARVRIGRQVASDDLVFLQATC